MGAAVVADVVYACVDLHVQGGAVNGGCPCPCPWVETDGGTAADGAIAGTSAPGGQ